MKTVSWLKLPCVSNIKAQRVKYCWKICNTVVLRKMIRKSSRLWSFIALLLYSNEILCIFSFWPDDKHLCTFKFYDSYQCENKSEVFRNDIKYCVDFNCCVFKESLCSFCKEMIKREEHHHSIHWRCNEQDNCKFLNLLSDLCLASLLTPVVLHTQTVFFSLFSDFLPDVLKYKNVQTFYVSA